MTYIVPADPIFHLLRVEFGGTNIGRFFLYFGAVEKNQSVTWFNGPLADIWDFTGNGAGLPLASGSIIKVKASHGRPFSGDFWARLHIMRIE